MTIMELGAIGELVGGVAVVATLIYLAMQVRQSTRSTHRTVYQAASSDSATWLMELAKDGELSRLYYQGLRAPTTLETDQLNRFYDFLGAFFAQLEANYLHNREFDEVESQQRWRAVMGRLLQSPGGESFWERRKWAYNPTFKNYVDRECRAPRRDPREA